ncbi:1-acyl-sn-glycerol-3-phosphate acyltransferase [Synechococcales cyanobacterium C]|uniref:1-acyl-sn-glycerol-3-phosphate acyltransferase n=1 Tax=Petrachloros mirabilis ULC683 TaxID=2781853 RepID=A0A8K1ZWN8_9CYAN|nr:lysophospholipid acyltransferase family protein [Petrachloros mirabilis]NCJ05503.1 1-acyl-sn-glycerol-3-phosphate acyltransferase [Petrachloros mirabilis ULC683]
MVCQKQLIRLLRVFFVSKPPAPQAAPRISSWLTPILYCLGQTLVLPLYFRHIQVQGLEHFPSHGSVLIAPTHRSRWDALILPYAMGYPVTGRDLYFMVSANEMRGIQGWLIRRCGGFAIDPDSPSIRAMRASIELLRQSKALVIFPEGNIFREFQVQNLKPGLARIALQSQRHSLKVPVHILPVRIKYQPVIPRWGSEVTVSIGPVLNTLAYVDASGKQAADRLCTDLSETLNSLHADTVTTASTRDARISPASQPQG